MAVREEIGRRGTPSSNGAAHVTTATATTTSATTTPWIHPCGGVLQPQGYIRIRRKPWRDRFEHQVVWMLSEGRLFVPVGHEVHHINYIPWDNRPENLILVNSSDHRLYGWHRRKHGKEIVTTMDMTEEQYLGLVGRGVSVPDERLMGVEWWEAKYGEVPF